MCCLHIVGMVVSPCTAHSFGLDMVGYDLAAIGEGSVADRAFSVLLHDLTVQQLPHFGP
jgi:hypothetical protein